ncbi:hypothetical protein SAMN05892873_12816 [Aeromonas veronii]|nr:hypothetical protein SAMN05892873_12816 [Aeromonas veronii]
MIVSRVGSISEALSDSGNSIAPFSRLLEKEEKGRG